MVVIVVVVVDVVAVVVVVVVVDVVVVPGTKQHPSYSCSSGTLHTQKKLDKNDEMTRLKTLTMSTILFFLTTIGSGTGSTLTFGQSTFLRIKTCRTSQFLIFALCPSHKYLSDCCT